MRLKVWNGLWVALTTAVMMTTLVRCQESLPPPADRDPFVGTWQSNRDASRPRWPTRDATYTRTIVRDGNEWIFSSRTTGHHPGEHHYRVYFDGQFHPAPDGIMVLRQYKAPNVIEGVSKLPGGETDYWRQEVSADGNQMTITGYKDKNRTKVKSVQVLDRVK